MSDDLDARGRIRMCLLAESQSREGADHEEDFE
jgi:hypothetical protein